MRQQQSRNNNNTLKRKTVARLEELLASPPARALPAPLHGSAGRCQAAGFGAHSAAAQGKINTGPLPLTHSRPSGAKEHRRRWNLIKAGTLRVAGLRAGSPLPAGRRLENPPAAAERYLKNNNNNNKQQQRRQEKQTQMRATARMQTFTDCSAVADVVLL